MNEESPYIAYRHRRIKKYRCEQMKRSRENKVMNKVMNKEQLINRLWDIYNSDDAKDMMCALKTLIDELEEGK